jgi:hypothetical protein
MTNLITAGFDSLPPADFLSQSRLIVNSMTGNPDFPEPWPAPVPSLATITADLSTYQDALDITLAGDRTQITARNSARATLSNDLLLLRLYVETMGNGNPAKIATSGFPLKQRSPRSLAVVPTVPPGFIISQGPVSGTISVKCRRVPGAGCYQVQLASADPTLEASWMDVGSFTRCQGIAIEGLTAGKIYSVRMRAVGNAGSGAWTLPASMMVI